MEHKIQEFFDKLNTSCETERATFSWVAKGIGYGTFTFYVADDDTLHCDNEAMSRKFIKDMLNKMVDDAIMDDPSQ